MAYMRKEQTLKKPIFSQSDADMAFQIGRYIDLNRRLQGETKLGMCRRMETTPNTYERLIQGQGKVTTMVAGLRVLNLVNTMEALIQTPSQCSRLVDAGNKLKATDNTLDHYDDDEDDREW
jgi:hypothetical protein